MIMRNAFSDNENARWRAKKPSWTFRYGSRVGLVNQRYRVVGFGSSAGYVRRSARRPNRPAETGATKNRLPDRPTHVSGVPNHRFCSPKRENSDRPLRRLRRCPVRCSVSYAKFVQNRRSRTGAFQFRVARG